MVKWVLMAMKFEPVLSCPKAVETRGQRINEITESEEENALKRLLA